MNITTKQLLLPSLLLLLAAAGCYNDKAELLYPVTGGCNTDSVTFSKTIQPIMNQSCALSNCHNTASAMSGVVLDNVAGVQAIANTRLLGVINHQSGFSHMPKDQAKLDDCTIQKITKWVALGALNN